jgi:glycyl-tRNA synthetase beta chain
MARLVFEIGTEELPSWYVTLGREALAALARERFERAGITFDALQTYATPRRLALDVEGMGERTAERLERRRGPAANVAFDAEGEPTKALAGFARSVGLEPAQLKVEEGEKGRYVVAELRRGGEESRAVLPKLLAGLVEDLPAPRKMRWGDIETPFVRPVAWLLALLDGEVLPVKAAGRCAGQATWGHRFLSAGELKVVHADEYLATLQAAYVLADPVARRERCWEAVLAAAAAHGLEPVQEASLLDEVANLVEYPVAVVGRLDERFLALPDEVLATTMMHHQRFFPLRGDSGRLAAAFAAVSNNRVPDEEVVRRGYRQVLEGRLYDAEFFWQADLRKPLAEHAEALAGIAFHKKLGSLAEKVSRVVEAAPLLGERVGLEEDERGVLQQAAPLFRADLATQMVYEFPELEGVMARVYALQEGLPREVAEALEHGVRPAGPTAPLPTAKVGAVLAVADRCDKLVGFFAAGERPSGSADPYGLRRDAIALARVLNARGFELRPREALAIAAERYPSALAPSETVVVDAERFVWERVVALLAEEGVPGALVRAAAFDGPSVIEASRRSYLLLALSGKDAFEPLLILYKRAANLAKEAPKSATLDAVALEPGYEAPLYEATQRARVAVDELLAQATGQLAPWDLGRGPARMLTGLEEPLAGVLAVKEPLDAFLDNVLVMVDEERVRNRRLALLREVRDVLRALGALEQLEGVQLG